MRARHISVRNVPSSLSRPARILLLAAALWWLHVTPAHAHRASITQSTVDVSPDRTTVDYRLEIEPPDTAELVGLAPNTDPTDAQVLAARARVLAYVLAHVQVRDGDVPCPPEPGDVAIARADRRIVAITWRARCPGPVRSLVLVYTLFQEIDPRFRALVRARHREQQAVAELGAAGNRFTWELGDPPPNGLAGFVGSGVEHILLGFDHIAFLLTLLLTLVVWRADGVRWEPRRLRHALRDTAVLVTAFTVAHSTTLIAASLGWIAASARVVESMIALSIVLVALENAFRPESGIRLLVALGFGLVHGLGFASVLAALLPPGDVIAPLLAFNLGVELGQLAIVAVILPALHVLVRLIGAAAYRTWFLSASSAILALLGALWLVERAFAIELFGL
jgi:hypothetical protein